jgi:hypothetical protein
MINCEWSLRGTSQIQDTVEMFYIYTFEAKILGYSKTRSWTEKENFKGKKQKKNKDQFANANDSWS